MKTIIKKLSVGICQPYAQSGITLTELMVALILMAIFLVSVVPVFAEMLDKHRLKSATETLYYTLHMAKSEAIKRNERVRVTFNSTNGGASWCYGLKIDASCDCTVSGSCQINGIEKKVSSNLFPGVKIDLHISSPGNRLTFENVRWMMAGTFGHIRFNSDQNKQARVIVSQASRIRLCSPTGEQNIAGYSTTC
jgi:type IV fimbrial biogenesis protein FimT